MRLQPLRSYTPPALPTRSEVEARPELLRRLPRRWQANPLLITALAASCGLLGGCRQAKNDGYLAGEPMPPPLAESRIAPLFEHGSGRAAFGGVPAPHYTTLLPEDEARTIIMEELDKAGITPSPDYALQEKVAIPVTNRYAFLKQQGEHERPETTPAILKLDGMSTTRGVGFEYVSQEDFATWETKNAGVVATAFEYDFHATAATLRAGLEQSKPAGAYAVFYDPIASAETKEEADRRSHEQLRLQVRGFIAWMKAEGII